MSCGTIARKLAASKKNLSSATVATIGSWKAGSRAYVLGELRRVCRRRLALDRTYEPTFTQIKVAASIMSYTVAAECLRGAVEAWLASAGQVELADPFSRSPDGLDVEKRAVEAEAGKTRKIPSSDDPDEKVMRDADPRRDYSIARIVSEWQITDEEQSEINLTVLVGDTRRCEVRRRAEGVAARVRDEPWKVIGVSKATYYRRINVAQPTRETRRETRTPITEDESPPGAVEGKLTGAGGLSLRSYVMGVGVSPESHVAQPTRETPSPAPAADPDRPWDAMDISRATYYRRHGRPAKAGGTPGGATTEPETVTPKPTMMKQAETAPDEPPCPESRLQTAAARRLAAAARKLGLVPNPYGRRGDAAGWWIAPGGVDLSAEEWEHIGLMAAEADHSMSVADARDAAVTVPKAGMTRLEYLAALSTGRTRAGVATVPSRNPAAETDDADVAEWAAPKRDDTTTTTNGCGPDNSQPARGWIAAQDQNCAGGAVVTLEPPPPDGGTPWHTTTTRPRAPALAAA